MVQVQGSAGKITGGIYENILKIIFSTLTMKLGDMAFLRSLLEVFLCLPKSHPHTGGLNERKSSTPACQSRAACF